MKTSRYFYFFVFVISISLFSCGSSKSSTSSSSKQKSKTTSSKSKSKVGNSAVKYAKSYVGTKYKYGGMSRKGMDCSGLMCISYQQAGVTIPRTSGQQSKIGKRVYIGELQVGDLVFFGSKPHSKKITHVGMISYVSGGSIKFIHASSSRGVIESELLSNYYKPRYVKAVRPKH